MKKNGKDLCDQSPTVSAIQPLNSITSLRQPSNSITSLSNIEMKTKEQS